MKITTIIHQSWKDDRIPHNVYRKAWIDSWLRHHPDWQRRFWTDADNDALASEYPAFWDSYRLLNPPIKKADFARLLYMHRYGGVYVDLDFISLKNLVPLLADNDIVLGGLAPENPCYHLPNAFLASSPGNSFWMQVAEDILNASPTEAARVETHTGPLRLEDAYERYQPVNTAVYRNGLIYPLDWIDLVRPERRQFALSLRDKSEGELAAIFPEAYCLTFWTHNWEPSRTPQSQATSPSRP
jgi:mannosyltransferase OCH1-like enzyme